MTTISNNPKPAKDAAKPKTIKVLEEKDQLKGMGIKGGEEPHQLFPAYIGPVVILASALVLGITAIATYLAINVASGIGYPYILLGMSLIGAWCVILAYLGKSIKVGSLSLFGKKGRSEE